MRALTVLMDGRVVGTVEGKDRRALRFRYDPSYADDPAATPLSVSMPLRESPYLHSTVDPYLWGLLPDNDRVLARWAREFGCSASDVIGLLAGVGADVAGAAQFVPPGAVPEESRRGKVEWVDDATVAQFVRELQNDTSAWRPSPQGRWSLAGAQAKIALLYDSKKDRWGVPSGSTPTTHILKPAIAGLDDFDINEHLCLAAAQKLGMRAATTTVKTFEGVRVLVVTRYDRVTRGGRLIRVHQEDLCQALGVHPDRKYESDGGPSAAAMGKLVRDVGGPGDATRLFDALAFNWLICATDGHAKNYSLLLSGAQVRLAPLYDVASGLHHLAVQQARLAQKIATENRPLRVRGRHWQRLAPSFGLGKDEAIDRIVSMIGRIPDAFTDAAKASEFDRIERNVAATIADQVVEWSGRCLRALDG